jgi:glycosyltransferase involved in cell wall biosynthesis
MNDATFGVSIIVCTYNGATRLPTTLEYIFKQIIPKNVSTELILVDNNSTDKSFAIANDLVQKFNFEDRYSYVNEAKQGLNFAVRRGINESKYDWILLCDDDNHLQNNYLEIGIEIIKSNNRIGALGGYGIPLFESVEPNWFDKYSGSYALGSQNDYDGKIEVNCAEIYGAGSFLRKAALQKFYDAGFQTIMSDRSGNKLTSGGDVERCFLIQLAGFEIWYDSRLTFKHLMPSNRLTWDYYLRLKSGIASGDALLSVYKNILNNKNLSTAKFLKIYISSLFKNILVFIKFKLKSTINPSSYTQELKDLGKVILPAKIKSYANNLIISYRHFTQIKRFI